jgi:hypothetical protein
LLLILLLSVVPGFGLVTIRLVGSRMIKTEHIQDYARSKTRFWEAFIQDFLKRKRGLWIRNSQAIQNWKHSEKNRKIRPEEIIG